MNPSLEDLVNNTDYSQLKAFNDHFEAVDAIMPDPIDAYKNFVKKFDKFFSENQTNHEDWHLLIETRDILKPRVEKCEATFARYLAAHMSNAEQMEKGYRRYTEQIYD